MIFPKLNSTAFRYDSSADNNRVFLFKACEQRPFIAIKKGWKIIGYTDSAPWPGSTDSFAIMLEAVGENDEECDEGTRIWHHFAKRWLERISQFESDTPA